MPYREKQVEEYTVFSMFFCLVYFEVLRIHSGVSPNLWRIAWFTRAKGIPNLGFRSEIPKIAPRSSFQGEGINNQYPMVFVLG